MAEARLLPYRLPLARPWRSAAGLITVRCGWLVELRDRAGRRGWGDCAPLPEAGTEGPDEAERWLRAALAGLEKAEDMDAALQALPAKAPPAARCALETALLDLDARRRGRPLCRRLAPGSDARVRVNRMLGAAAEAATLAPARDGCQVLKLKLGVTEFAQELAALEPFCARLPPGVRLRLDANRAWSLPEARANLAALARLPVEAVEEPLREPTLEALAGLQAAVPFALALDESLRRFDQAALLESKAVRRLVLKPMVLGGLLPCLTLAARAQAAGLECVVTTVVESAVGCWAGAHLAAALGPSAPPHGLATSEWLMEDVAPAPPVQDGEIQLGPGAGLGITPHPAWLARAGALDAQPPGGP